MPVRPTRVPFTAFAPTYTVPGYSPADALSLCLASNLAYAKKQNKRIDREKIRNITKKWGFPAVESFEIVRGHDIDTQGYVAINNTHILVAFRGSESLPDWLTNFQAVKDPGPWKNTEVHEGFQDAFMAVALKIGQIIGREHKSQQIWLTGHSLGGALAVLLAATLRESRISVTGLYTFAAPRVGDAAFVEKLNKSLQRCAHWRVVNEGDFVPHLLPVFSHAGRRKLLLNNGRVSESKRVWDRFERGILAWVRQKIGKAKMKIAGPHQLDSANGYLQRLWQQQKEMP